MNRMVLLVALSAVLAIVLAACAGETAAPQVIEKEVIVEKEVVREVPVEKVVTQEIVKTIEVPVEKVVTQEVIKEVQVPGETVVVTKEVVKEVPVEVVVTKEVVKEVPVEVVVEVPKEVVREVVRIVEVEKPSIAQYGEAPQLAQLVAAGKLPPVAERLPSNPMVIPVFGEIGKYGGLIRRGYIGSNLSCNYGRPIRTGLLRFSTDGFSLVPAVAESIERNDDGTVWTAKLREGMKWSDGAPFTADDFTFHLKMVLDDRITPIVPTWIRLGEKNGEVVKVDDNTVEFRFPASNYPFVESLAFSDGDCGRTRRHRIPFAPAHYLEQFHLDFNPNAPKLAEDGGFESWTNMYAQKDYPIGNPDRPSTRPWVPTSGVTGKRIEGVRNPYFYAVDPVGNQLPYLDKFVWDKIDKTVLQLKAIAGEIDFQGRHIALEEFPTLKANEDKGGYRVLLWPSMQESDALVRINQTHEGPEGEYFRMAKFRQALSLAVDREEINNVIFHGTGDGKQAVPLKGHPLYPGDEVAYMWTGYDPDRANQMLDEIMPNRDSDGFRLMSNGDRLHIVILSSVEFGAYPDMTEMVARNWGAVGVSAVLLNTKRVLVGERRTANTIGVDITGGIGSAGFMFTFPGALLPNDAGSWGWGSWYNSRGEKGIEPPDDVKALYALWDKGKVSPEAERIEIGKELYRRLATEVTTIGLIGSSPMDMGTFIVNKKLRNVPDQAANAWAVRTPSPAYPEQFWYAD